MVNPFKDTNWNPGLAERRSFARTMAIGFLIFKAVLLLAVYMQLIAPKPTLSLVFNIGIGLGVLLWVWPAIAKPFYVVWFGVACCFGIVISNLLLTLFYYLLVTPIGLIMRATGHDPLQRRIDRSRASYWRDTEKITDPQRYFRQF